MTWSFDGNSPVSLQIANALRLEILMGNFKPGDLFPTVRQLACEAYVNPNTVQKALTLLTEQGLIYPMRVSGMYVNDNTARAVNHVEELKRIKTSEFFEEMRSLGLSIEEIQNYVKEWKQ